MIMLEVMYGMMPSAKTESWSSAPPLNRLTREYRFRWSPLLTAFRQFWIASVETPGEGIVLPTRNSTMIPSVNRSFLRRSGVRKALPKAASTAPPFGDGIAQTAHGGASGRDSTDSCG